MKRLVYTCVFGGYDRVFAPLHPEPGIDYVIVTDEAGLTVPGWQVHPVDISAFDTATLSNRYYKIVGHRVFPGYDAALYIDGNIRLLGPVSELFDQVAETPAALRLFRHPQRSNVAAELAECLARGKLTDAPAAQAELAAYQADGFTDDQGLIEATILLKNHRDPALAVALDLWWDCYNRHRTRDQLSLPYVLWKTGLTVSYHAFHFRDPNRYFGLYPHRGAAGVRPAYADLAARAYDSAPHKALLGLWHGWWRVRRGLRNSKKV